MSFLTQNDMFHPVVDFIRKQGIVTLQDIHKFVRDHFGLTPQKNPDDFVPIGTHDHRYENQASNLKSTDVIIKRCPDIKHVEDGFATVQYLSQHPEVVVQEVRNHHGGYRVGRRVSNSIAMQRSKADLSKQLFAYYKGLPLAEQGKVKSKITYNMQPLVDSMYSKGITPQQVLGV